MYTIESFSELLGLDNPLFCEFLLNPVKFGVLFNDVTVLAELTPFNSSFELAISSWICSKAQAKFLEFVLFNKLNSFVKYLYREDFCVNIEFSVASKHGYLLFSFFLINFKLRHAIVFE